jgi:hypothetical protein
MEENLNLEIVPQLDQETTVPVVTEDAAAFEGVAVKAEVSTKPKPSRKQIPQLTEQEMVNIIKRFKESGLTRRAFCLENNYGLSSLYYWQKKYDELFPEENPKKANIEKKKAAKSVKAAKTTPPPKAKKEATKKAAKTKKSETPMVDTAVAVAEVSVKEPKVKTRVKKSVENEPTVEAMPAKRRGRPAGSKNKPKPGEIIEVPKQKKTKPIVEEPVIATADAAPVVAEKKKPGRPAKAKEIKKVVAAKKGGRKVAPKAIQEVVIPTPTEVPVAPQPPVAKRGRKPAAAVPVAAAGPVMQIKYPNGVRINVSGDISLERLKELISL